MSQPVYWDELYEPAEHPADSFRRRTGLRELAAALEREGVRQPLVVRPQPAPPGASFGARYAIVHGRRRWRAACALVLAGRWAPDVTLPCHIVDFEDRTIGGENHVQRQ